jgi:hypothetical protein
MALGIRGILDRLHKILDTLLEQTLRTLSEHGHLCFW